MATDWAAEAAKFGGQAAQATPPGKTDWAAEAAKFGGKAAQVQPTPEGRAPDWTDDVKASASFLGNELAGVGHALNPVNIVGGIANTVAHPVDTVTALVKMPKTMYDQYQSGDMEGLAKNIGNIAGGVILGKVAPDAPGAASDAAGAVSKLGSKVNSVASNVANSPMVKAAGPVLLKQGIKTAATYVPVVGPMLRTGFDIWEAASKLQKMADTAKAATESEALTAAAAQTPSAPPQVSTKVQIPTKFSPESASDTMGTRAPSATPTPAPEAASGLDQTTHQRLAEAVQSGKLQALPADAKASITQAVKAGDTTRVNAILDLGRDVSISELKHIASTNNKVAVLLKYATDHGIDIESVPPEERQTFADAAMAHAKQLGLTDLLSTNKSGRYTGTHESAFALMKAKLAAGGR